MSSNSTSDFFSFNRAAKKFDDPFTLYSDQHFPENLSSALELCRHLWYLLPRYRQASQRVARYFITEVEIKGEGAPSEKQEFKDYLKDSLGVRSTLIEAGDDERCYGNGFFYMYRPFARRLLDKRDGTLTLYELEAFPKHLVAFDLKNMSYEVPDPKGKGDLASRKKVKMEFKDFKLKDRNMIKIRKLDPRYVAIRHGFISGDKQIVYRFEQIIKNEIKAGKLNQIDTTPKSMLEAIKDDKDYLFNKDEVFHLAAPTISGISYHGWALPEPIANYRSIYQMQVYRKADEAVGLDYVLPFRIFSPEASGQAGEFINTSSMRNWNNQMQRMIATRRTDKTAIHAFPFPVNYGEMGGNGKEYAQKDLIEYHSNELLVSAGYPVELFNGTIQLQMVPTTLRLFENSHWHLYDNFNRMLGWIAGRVKDYTGEFEGLEACLTRPSLADNIDKQAMLYQLGTQGELPRRVYMGPVGVDNPEEAMRERVDEDMRMEKVRMEKTEEFETEMRNTIAEQAVNGPAGAGGGGGESTPQDIEEEAMMKAQEWLAIESDGERSKAMNAMKVQNMNLYSLAKQNMEDMRAQAAAEGRQGAGQQPQQ